MVKEPLVFIFRGGSKKTLASLLLVGSQISDRCNFLCRYRITSPAAAVDWDWPKEEHDAPKDAISVTNKPRSTQLLTNQTCVVSGRKVLLSVVRAQTLLLFALLVHLQHSSVFIFMLFFEILI